MILCYWRARSLSACVRVALRICHFFNRGENCGDFSADNAAVRRIWRGRRAIQASDASSPYWTPEEGNTRERELRRHTPFRRGVGRSSASYVF